MKRATLLLVLICIWTNALSQTMPEVTVGDDHLKLSKLDITTTIVGNMASTTYDMIFYNPQNRVLEGELAFPLGQGQRVTHFAMDINGNLRDAVIVEKELGRVAFENTTRQTIDPGLLEKTKGNNYKARIFPIPAKGNKRIIVTFEQTLFSSEGYHQMEIALNCKQELDEFSISIECMSASVPEFQRNIYEGLEFKSKDGKIVANFKKNKFAPEHAIALKLPISDDQTVAIYRDYFNVYKVFDMAPKPKIKPEKVTLFWDVSYSMKYRKSEKELLLLNNYFKYLNTVDVRLIMFSNSIKKDVNFSINNGNWNALKKTIEEAVYDGGTSYLYLIDYLSDENLFFTDGMDNLGDLDFKNTGLETPSIMTINAVSSSNHEKLKNIAHHSGSQYINMNLQSVSSAFDVLINESYKFLGYKSNDVVSEVFPKKFASVQGGISISGRFNNDTTVELLFGYNYEDFDVFKVDLDRSKNNPIVKRLWAIEKLNHLSKNKKENKTAIIDLAKRYHLISDYTSMIVLDRIEDYVRYKIEPPNALMAEYKERIQKANEDQLDRLDDLKDRKEELTEEYDDLMSWYNTDFSKLKAIENVKIKPTQAASTTAIESKQENNNSEETVTESVTQNAEEIQNEDVIVESNHDDSEIDGELRVISGVVTSVNDRLPLPGVNVIVKGTSRGTQTDFDGNYTIDIGTNETLVFSYIGFVTMEVAIEDSRNVSINLESDNSQLDEVVVVAYATTTRKQSISASTVTVTTEKTDSNLNSDFVQTLAGQVSGLKIENGSEEFNGNSKIILRGVGTINGNAEPLFIIDGTPVDEGTFKSLDTNEIESINILNGAGATAIYGNRASNGVMVITTKEGLETKRNKIEALNTKINNEFELKPWIPNAEYVRILSNMESTEKAYSTYLDLRNTYHNVPTFFMDVADFFESKNESDIAIQIRTNLIEIDIDNHELMRALAYKFEETKNYGAAVYVYEAILEMRPEHPQSYRDLALAYEEAGYHQKAFDLLYKIVNGDLLEKDEDERFFGIEQIAYVEACHLITRHKKRLDISDEQLKLFGELNMDVRVVIDWNQDNTDIDLWVVNPENEKIYYSNNKSKHGGRLSEDLTEGYGPEEFLLKKAKKGNYEVVVDYFGNDVQKISGPTTLKITMFTNYGTKKETKIVRVMRLSKMEKEYEVGAVNF